MKIAEYNEMMAYLLRPAQEAKLVDDLEPGSLRDELLKDFDPSQETYEEYLQRKSMRENAAYGGRIGFSKGTKPFQVASGKRKGLYAVRSRFNLDDVADAIDSSTDFIYFNNKTDANKFYNSIPRRGSETYIGEENFIKERKKFPKLNVDEFAAKMNELGYTDAGGKKLDAEKIKQYHATFNVPLDKDAYKLKAPGAKKTRASDDPQRLKEIDDYVKEFETDYGRKPTSKNIVDALQEQRRVIPFYEKEYGVTLPKGSGQKITNVDKDVVKILKDPKIIAKLEAGKFPTITDISRITKLDVALSETRLVDVAEKLRENPKYKTLADNYLDQPGLTNLDEGFGGRKRKRSRAILENRFTKLMGLDKKLPTLRSNILRKIQSFIPDLKGILAVDEIAGITSSMRHGSGPYAIFGQVLGGDFNTQVKGHGIDKEKGVIEKQLVKLAKDDPKRIELQTRYNTGITEFENKANKNNPAKKVRGLKLSYKAPSTTIKNKKIYNQYKDLFDAHYEKYGYSFEVPADRDSLVDISKKLDNKSFQNTVKNRFKNLLGRGGKVGVATALATLAGTGFALADEKGEVKEVAGPFDYMQDQQGFTTAEKTGIGAGAAGAAYAARKPILSTLGKIARPVGRVLGAPSVGGGLALSEFLNINPFSEEFGDLKEDPNYSIAGADLLLPELAKKVGVRGALANPFGIGRFMTPVGTALITGDTLAKRAKQMMETSDEISDMEAGDEQDSLLEEYAAKDYRGYDKGGIVSLRRYK